MMLTTKSKSLALFGTFLLVVSIASGNAVQAQGYVFAGDGNGLDVVAHPTGYDGTGGVLNVTVGIDPTSVNFNDMIIPTRNVVNTWNRLEATTGNLSFGLPSNTFDFESVLLHEVGHSLGLSHVNIGAGGGAGSDYSFSTQGVNGVFNFNPGVDGIIGSSDDVRGDDASLNYFKIADNNPFTLESSLIFDSTTYSRDIALLPSGHLYAANTDRAVGDLLGFANTEGVMQQGQFNDEIQRDLAASDVVGIRYAESGLDELQGTADDYDLVLDYVVWDGNASTRPDILIDMDTSTGFAVSSSGGQFINGTDHIEIVNNEIFINPTFDWYFNTVLAIPEPGSLLLLSLAGAGLALRRRRV